MNSRPWTYQEIMTLYAEYPSTDIAELEKKLDRTAKSINQKAMKLRVYNKVPFSEKEITLAAKYGEELGKSLIFLLPERTPNELEVLLRFINL